MHNDMIERFQCAGCVNGSDTKCGKFNEVGVSSGFCANHVVGTFSLGVGHFLLGMPKGFNKSGFVLDNDGKLKSINKTQIVMYHKTDNYNIWNNLNVPVWALEKDGFTFVRVYMPRMNTPLTQVIEGNKFGDIRKAGFNVIDVSQLDGEFD